jgi:hypothetical protein
MVLFRTMSHLSSDIPPRKPSTIASRRLPRAVLLKQFMEEHELDFLALTRGTRPHAVEPNHLALGASADSYDVQLLAAICRHEVGSDWGVMICTSAVFRRRAPSKGSGRRFRCRPESRSARSSRLA